MPQQHNKPRRKQKKAPQQQKQTPQQQQQQQTNITIHLSVRVLSILFAAITASTSHITPSSCLTSSSRNSCKRNISTVAVSSSSSNSSANYWSLQPSHHSVCQSSRGRFPTCTHQTPRQPCVQRLICLAVILVSPPCRSLLTLYFTTVRGVALAAFPLLCRAAAACDGGRCIRSSSSSSSRGWSRQPSKQTPDRRGWRQPT